MARAYLGVDYGERRVGLALAIDGDRARPWRTLRVDSLTHAIQAVSQTASRVEGLVAIVLGLPRNLDGDDTPQTMRVRQFADLLALDSGYKVELVDEAATSSEAEARLKLGGNYRREEIDALAAAIILQDYLDTL